MPVYFISVKPFFFKFPIAFCVFLFFFGFRSKCFAQSKDFQDTSFNAAIVNVAFNHEETPQQRRIIDIKQLSLVAKINPLTYIGAGLMFVYQNVISEQIQATCNYEISCSEYTKRCIESKGIISGTLLGLSQLNNCFEGVLFDYPNHLISPGGKIVNSIP